MNSFTTETGGTEMVSGAHPECTDEHMDTQNCYEEQDGSATAAANAARPRELTELEKYWQAVRENPADFTGWTYLLQYVEQENNLPAAREAFEAFFKYYPYCYGYWKKYADMEKKLNTAEKCKEIFEKGLQAIPLSVDLWVHYINFYKAHCKDDPDYYDKVKSVFEQAIQAAGREFRSDRLWDLYISWEQENNNLKAVTAIYDSVLTVPTQLYNHHFEKFQEHAANNLPKDILTTDEFLELRQEYVSTRGKQEDGGPEEEETSSDILPPGVEEEDAPPGVAMSEKGDKDSNSEETKFIRDKLVEKRRVIYRQNEEEVTKRWTFEDGIKRPYFHVKPLERSQLKNWREYLDWEIQNGTHDRVIILFERCMIACALYEDMWMKYANYMELHDEAAAREVYRRACTIHLTRKPVINMAWACFEERKNHPQEAIAILTSLETTIPDFLEATLRKINVERRQKNHDQVEKLYRTCIEQAKTVRMGSHFAIKLSRFFYKVCGSYEKAEQVLKEQLQKDPTNTLLYAQLVDIGYQMNPIDEGRILAAFDMALASELEEEQKVLFAQRKVEYLEDFGHDLQKIQDAFEEYTKLAKNHGASAKKRAAEMSDDASKDKKARTTADVNGVLATNNTAAMQAAAQPVVTQQAAVAQVAQDSSAYYQQSWAGYTQSPYNYQQTWSHYPASYYPSHG